MASDAYATFVGEIEQIESAQSSVVLPNVVTLPPPSDPLTQPSPTADLAVAAPLWKEPEVASAQPKPMPAPAAPSPAPAPAAPAQACRPPGLDRHAPLVQGQNVQHGSVELDDVENPLVVYLHKLEKKI